jgi:hypothetical protein
MSASNILNALRLAERELVAMQLNGEALKAIRSAVDELEAWTVLDGGPAFPHVAELQCHARDGVMHTKPITSGGMSMLDYMATHLDVSKYLDESGDVPAGLALALMRNQVELTASKSPLCYASWWAEALARFRYLHASAMLRARASVSQ